MSGKGHKKGRPTIRDVAKMAGVAPITVSRVVNNTGYISAETRLRVERAIQALNYIPNTLAQSLRFQRTDMVTLLVSDVTNTFWTTITRGVEDVCNSHSLNVILCNTDEKSEKLERYVQLLLQRQTDGFIIAPVNQDTAIIQSVINNGVPVVLIDRLLESLDVSVVYSDGESGAYRLVQHLIDLGHRQIVALVGHQQQSTSRQRVGGYRRALEDNGLPVYEQLITYGHYTQQGGYEATHRILESVSPRPTAIFAANNFIAMGVQKALAERGLQVPADISLVTFDDDNPYDHNPFLTTALQDPYRIGQEAANLLLWQLQNNDEPYTPEALVLPVEIAIRHSTAPPNTTRKTEMASPTKSDQKAKRKPL